jgi:hypothetical protein
VVAQSQQALLGVFPLAVLEVAPGKISRFIAALEAADEALPIGVCVELGGGVETPARRRSYPAGNTQGKGQPGIPTLSTGSG